MNFCVTDGESVIATRYISSRRDEAASLVGFTQCIMWKGLLILFNFSGSRLGRHSASMLKVVITGCRKLIRGRILSWWTFFQFNHAVLFLIF